MIQATTFLTCTGTVNDIGIHAIALHSLCILYVMMNQTSIDPATLHANIPRG